MRRVNTFLFLLVCAVGVARGDTHSKRADELSAKAEELIDGSQFEQAAELLRNAISAEQSSTAPRPYELARFHTIVAYAYQQAGHFVQALQSLHVARGMLAALNDTSSCATVDMNLGIAYKSIGRFDSAAVCYKRARHVFELLADSANLAMLYGNIAVLYRTLGRYDRALDFNHRSLAIDERRGHDYGRLARLNNLAGVHYSMEDLDKALEYQRRALALARKVEDDYRATIILSNMAELLADQQRFDTAITCYREAREGYRRTNDREGMAIAMRGIGGVYLKQGKYPLAFGWYQRSLDLNRTMRRAHGVAAGLTDLGVLRWHEGAYAAAVDSLRQAVTILDSLRLTATGDLRRDYLSSQIDTYQWLVSALVRLGKDTEAFDEAERASAKYLVEQLGQTENGVPWRGVERWRKGLDNTTAVVCYANVKAETPPVRFVVTRETVTALKVGVDSLARTLVPRCPRATRRTSGTRGIRVAGRTQSAVKPPSLDGLVNCYRELLAEPSSDLAALRGLGTGLYEVLFTGLERTLNGITTLIVIPDGSLGLLPFEALILPDNRFLVERFVVRYAQSLRVLERVAQRHHGRRRRPLAAFGGARYDTAVSSEVHLQTREQLDAVADFARGLSRGATGMAEAYAAAGLASWPNLPGTLHEVQTLGRIVPRATVVTGEKVCERAIKAASRDGKLRRFEVLHFATHGVVVPELAELSALVLSTPSEPDTVDDGYLRMKEIAELDLGADLVNLSACETGLGRIYGGERVVGLTQAFLIAGANGVTASLWQVADESTMKFMVGLYALMQDGDTPCPAALASMKRRFIAASEEIDNALVTRGIAVKGKSNAPKRGAYAHPYYWAPFVYYGR